MIIAPIKIKDSSIYTLLQQVPTPPFGYSTTPNGGVKEFIGR
jgi:hypothetical protein